jgi:hypothetical protein
MNNQPPEQPLEDRPPVPENPTPSPEQPSGPRVIDVESEPSPASYSAVKAETPATEVDNTTVTGGVVAPKSSKKKGFLIGAIVTGVIALIIAGGALAYNFWYQNPDKVVTDSVLQAITAKSATYSGTLVSTGTTKLNLSFDGNAAEGASTTHTKIILSQGATDYTIDGNILFSSEGDLYVKVANARDLVQTYRAQIPASAAASFDQLIDKVHDKWVKISATDLKSLSQDAGTTQQCMSGVVKDFQSDRQAGEELRKLYEKNRFIIVEERLGSRDGSLGYKLGFNATAAKAFVKESKSTKLYASLQKCDETFSLDEEKLFDESAQKGASEMNLWVDRWTHQVTRFQFTSTGEDVRSGQVNFLVEPKFNQPVKVETPQEATTLAELKADFEKLIQASMSQ